MSKSGEGLTKRVTSLTAQVVSSVREENPFVSKWDLRLRRPTLCCIAVSAEAA